MKDIVVLRFYISSIKIWIIYHNMQLVCLHVQTWQCNATLMRTCETHWYFCAELFRALRGPTHYISIITNIMRTWTTQIWYGLLYHLIWTVRCCHFLLVDSLGTPSIACLSLIYLVRPYVKKQCFQVTKYVPQYAKTSEDLWYTILSLLAYHVEHIPRLLRTQFCSYVITEFQT